MSHLILKHQLNNNKGSGKIQRIKFRDGSYGYVPVNEDDSVIEGAYDNNGRIKIYSREDLTGPHLWVTLDRDKPLVGIQRTPDDHYAALSRDRAADEHVDQVIGDSDNYTPWGLLGKGINFSLGKVMEQLPESAQQAIAKGRYLAPSYWLARASGETDNLIMSGNSKFFGTGTSMIFDSAAAPLIGKTVGTTLKTTPYLLGKYGGNTALGNWGRNRTLSRIMNESLGDTANPGALYDSYGPYNTRLYFPYMSRVGRFVESPTTERSGIGAAKNFMESDRSGFEFTPHIPETSSFRTFNPQREGFPLYGLPTISDPSKIVFNIPKGKLTLGELSEIKSGIDSLIKNGSTQMQTANGFKIAYSPQYKIFGILRGNFMTNSRILDSYFDKHLAPLRIQYPKERLAGETPQQILERITDTSLPYGYDIEEMVKLAQTEFNPQNLAFSRPVLDYLIRNSRDKETLSRALNMVLNGESKSKFGQGFLTLMSPTPDLVLQATYMDLSGRGYPLYGAGYISSGPIAEGLNPLLGTYRGGNFGDYVSVTNNLLGGGKYGHTNFPELRNYLRTIDINPEGLLSIEQLMKRIEDFENNPRYKGKNFGKTEVNTDGTPNNGTVNGLISDKGRKDPSYSQYLRDRELLLLKLSGLMDYGAKNLQIVFRAPYLEDMAFTRTNEAPIGLNQTALYSVYDYNGFPLYDTSGNLIWKSNIQNLERGISKRYPGKHLWYVGPNPHEGMITFQASGIKPVLKEGGLIKKLLKNNLRHGKIHKNN